MGSVRVDIHKRAKALGQMYPHTSDGIARFLRNIHHLRMARLRGDLDASAMLIDFMRAYRAAPLSQRELDVLYYRYELQMSQRDTAIALALSHQTVHSYEERAIAKIAKTLAAMDSA